MYVVPAEGRRLDSNQKATLITDYKRNILIKIRGGAEIAENAKGA